MVAVHHRYVGVQGRQLFYREAGPAGAPALVLLHGFPTLAVWGKGDQIFAPAGARAFADDLPSARIHLLDGGHFLLESALDEVTALIRDFLGQAELRP